MAVTDYLGEHHQICIEHVWPEVDCGLHAIKRVLGDQVEVQADIFRDGHGHVAAALRYLHVSGSGSGVEEWHEVCMWPLDNDRWAGRFHVSALGRYCYQIEAWNDRFGTWRADMERRVQAGEVGPGDVQEGVALIEAAVGRMEPGEAAQTRGVVAAANAAATPLEAGALLLCDDLGQLMNRYPDRTAAARSSALEVIVDPRAARFSAWYEIFPRSAGESGVHGTLRDVIAQLPRIAGMGFDVLYLPPIHPIGHTHRKGRNNALVAEEGDVGSPWAIGNGDGGHKSIEPALGTFDDFDALVAACHDHGIQLCLDFAIQCSPDHPYTRDHPEWFFARPDGSIKYAENPPKKYQDIYPLNFYCSDSEALWQELKSIVVFWIERGVKVFRVDNPHTKPIPFWEWLIGEVKATYPETIFLAEAFTRPKVMRALAKVGFTQSYTYFTWRTSRTDLMGYLSELTQTEMAQYFRGNLWPNTPDILHDFLQHGGLPAFRLRLVLAATLSSAYGIYSGYELGINSPATARSEEYLDSDKYQVNTYNWNQPHYIGDFIARINQIRHENPALQLYDNLMFHQGGENSNILAYSKGTPDGVNRVLVVVNLDPFHAQESWVGVPFWEWGFGQDEPYHVHDLISRETYTWQGEYNYVRLDPVWGPAHIFVVQR